MQSAALGDGPTEKVLARLAAMKLGPRRSGSNWAARCPAHSDKNASLSVCVGREGHALVKCHAGCTFEAITDALGMKPADLRAGESDLPQRSRAPLFLADLARTKSLPIEFLQGLDWHDASDRRGMAFVAIPYINRDGEVHRTRQRYGGTDRFRWATDGEGAIAYEPDQGQAARREGYLVVVEGETDTATLLHAGIPALGLPGASSAKPLARHHVAGVQRIYVVQETDAAGERFPQLVASRLESLGFDGEVRGLPMPDSAKDPSALWCRQPDREAFADKIREAMEKSLPAAAHLEGERGGNAEEWPRPEPIGRDAKPVPFPLHALAPWIRDFVAAEALTTQTPVDMAAVFALGGLAAAIGGYARVRAWGGFEEACNLYTVVAMPPSSIKSPVHRHVCAPLERLEEELRAAAEPQIAQAQTQREILERRLKKALDSASKAKALERDDAESEARHAREELDACMVPAVPRLIVDDSTPEQLKSLLAEHNGRLAMLSAESAFFGNVASQRYSQAPNLEAALAGHSGDPIRVDRRGRHEILKDPRLTICIAVQPSVLMDAARSEAARGRGLFARFLYSIPTPNVGYRDLSSIPPEVPTEITEAWSVGLIALAKSLRARAEPLPLALSVEARDRFQAWRAQMEPALRPGGALSSIDSWAGKLHGHVLRLAGILHLSAAPGGCEGTEIDVETLEGAIELARYFTAHAMSAFDVMGDDEGTANMRKVLAWVRARELVKFARGDAQRAFKGRLSREQMTDALTKLVEHGHLRVERRQGTGRAAEVYEVNPQTLQGRKP